MRRIHFTTTDSTNAQARAAAAAHPGERLLVTADEQSAGRGRRGRSWGSPRGGAWMSVVWPITKEPREFAAASLVAAVAVRRGVLAVMEGAVGSGAKPQAAGAPAVQIKWPNDLLVCDRKVAGILCEQLLSGALGNVLIVGIGVNVDFDLALLGPASELRHPPTTLAAALVRTVSVDDVIASVAQRVEEAFQDYERDGLDAALLAELRANLAYIGEVRSFSSPKGIVTGRVIGIDDEGRLLLESEGREIRCDVGEWIINTSGR